LLPPAPPHFPTRRSSDLLNRVTQSNGLVSGTRSYTYDRDSNRRTKTEGGATYTDTLDRTDELVSVLKSGGTTQSFAYDRYGNLTDRKSTRLNSSHEWISY